MEIFLNKVKEIFLPVLKFKITRIQSKIIITFVFIIIVPTLFTSLITFNRYEASLKSRVSEFSAALVEQINYSIDTYMKDIDRISKTPYYDNDMQDILMKIYEGKDENYIYDLYINRKIDSFMDDVMRQKDGILSIFILDKNGNVLFTRSIVGDYDGSFDTKNLCNVTEIINNKPIIIPTHKQVYVRNSNSDVFSYVRDIKEVTTNTTIGYILINININSIIDILSSIKYSNSWDVIITNNDNKLIYYRGREYLGQKLNTEYALNTEGIGGAKEVGLSQDSYMLAYNVSKFTGFKVILSNRTSELLKDIYLIRKLNIVVVLLFILLALGISIAISFNITRPVKKLAAVMMKVENGDFNVKAEVRTNDEFVKLAEGFNRMIKYIDELINREYKARINEKEAELMALQNQINPHFLYNTLESITMKAEINDDLEVSDMVSALGKLFRLSISKGMEFVKLGQEIEHVKLYIKIQNIRYKNKFNVTYSVDNELLDCIMPKLILQPIVENSINHGFENRKEMCNIKIFAVKQESNLIIKVIDDGNGIENNRLEEIRKQIEDEYAMGERVNIGLRNVNQRIKLSYGARYGLLIESEPGKGTSVEVRIPYKASIEGGNFYD